MLRTRRFLTMTLLCLAFILPSVGQYSEEEVEALNTARTLLASKKWKKAEKAFRKITEDNPEIGPAWMGLGLALNGDDRLEDAIEAYQGALETDYRAAVMHYNVACAYSRLNRPDEAFAELDKALELGFTNRRMLEGDGDLDNLRSDPRFAVVLIRVGADACAVQEQYSGLDFWTGPWEAGADGGTEIAVYGIDKIKVLKGCLGLEFSRFDSYEQASTGFLYYDPSVHQWRHEAFTTSGAILRHAGRVTDGQVFLEGQRIESDGTVELSRITLNPEGKDLGRRKVERSDDGGVSWHVDSESVLRSFKGRVPRRVWRKGNNPCMADTRRAELDSWMGTWEMTGRDGARLGSHSLRRRRDGCLIQGWFAPVTGAAAYIWTYFDAVADQWKQNWVTAAGDLIRYSGGPEHGELRFQGERIRWDGSKVSSRSRTTVSAEGTSRYRIEESDDGGKTWNLWLDATCVRREPGEADSKSQGH